MDEKQRMWLWIGLFLLVLGLISSVMQGRPERKESSKPKIQRLILDRDNTGSANTLPSEERKNQKDTVEEDISYFQ